MVFGRTDVRTYVRTDSHVRVFPLSVLVSIEKIHQTLETVFNHISRRLKARQKYNVKYSLSCLIYNLNQCAMQEGMFHSADCLSSDSYWSIEM